MLVRNMTAAPSPSQTTATFFTVEAFVRARRIDRYLKISYGHEVEASTPFQILRLYGKLSTAVKQRSCTRAGGMERGVTIRQSLIIWKTCHRAALSSFGCTCKQTVKLVLTKFVGLILVLFVVSHVMHRPHGYDLGHWYFQPYLHKHKVLVPKL